MKQKIKIKRRVKETILFAGVSSVGTLADCLLLTILTIFSVNEVIANGVSYAVGVAVAFVLSRSLVFHVKDKIAKRAFMTIICHGIGLIVQTQLISWLIDDCDISLVNAKIIGIAENAVLMYFASAFLIFRKSKTKNNIGFGLIGLEQMFF